MKLLNSIGRVAGNVLLIPVAVVKDAATLAGGLIKKVPNTFETARRVSNAASDVADDIKEPNKRVE